MRDSTLAVGGLPSTPFHEQGRPLFQHLLHGIMPNYSRPVNFSPLAVSPRQTHDASVRLREVSATHYLPTHSYERRTFVKCRSRELRGPSRRSRCRISSSPRAPTVHHGLGALSGTDEGCGCSLRSSGLISLNHMVEGVYRTDAEDRLLHEMRTRFAEPSAQTGVIRLSRPGREIALGRESILGAG